MDNIFEDEWSEQEEEREEEEERERLEIEEDANGYSEEPEYNPEDDPDWDESRLDRLERERIEDSYDYVQDDFNYDSNRERGGF